MERSSSIHLPVIGSKFQPRGAKKESMVTTKFDAKASRESTTKKRTESPSSIGSDELQKMIHDISVREGMTPAEIEARFAYVEEYWSEVETLRNSRA